MFGIATKRELENLRSEVAELKRCLEVSEYLRIGTDMRVFLASPDARPKISIKDAIDRITDHLGISFQSECGTPARIVLKETPPVGRMWWFNEACKVKTPKAKPSKKK